jgi:hypothetical protein
MRFASLCCGRAAALPLLIFEPASAVFKMILLPPLDGAGGRGGLPRALVPAVIEGRVIYATAFGELPAQREWGNA